MSTAQPSREAIRSLPKVLLHDHLDGGVRPSTVLEIAEQQGHELPVSGTGATPEGLAAWFREAADSGSLERYLETFAHTVAVMQTPEAVARVARECVLDLAEDGVVYAESRFAPEQHLRGGMELPEVVEAALAGFREGERLAAEAGRPIVVRALLTAMRHAAKSREIAELAVRYRDDGVGGFDIAGAEAGYPPSRHLDAFEYLRTENAHFTIHAGEAFGLPSIWEALQWCGADRLGHGVRIVDDIGIGGATVTDDPGAALAAVHEDPSRLRLGRLAAFLRDTRVPLEMCPHSNVQTGAARSIASHPIPLLTRLRYRVTLNTDNRLMSDTSMSKEMHALVTDAGWQLEDLRWVTTNAMKSAFLPFDERLELIEGTIKPGYAAAARA